MWKVTLPSFLPPEDLLLGENMAFPEFGRTRRWRTTVVPFVAGDRFECNLVHVKPSVKRRMLPREDETRTTVDHATVLSCFWRPRSGATADEWESVTVITTRKKESFSA